jgi:hypothetical protein
MSSIYKCNFCDKEFSNKSSLNNHQKTAKYCLTKQGLVSSFKCNGCDKLFGTNLRLNEHILICKKRKEIIYNSDIKNLKDDKDRYIKELKDNIQLLVNKHVQEIKEERDRHSHELKEERERHSQEIRERDKVIERHIQELKDERDKHIQELKNMLENANKTINEIAKQPKTTNTTNIKGNQNIKNVLTSNDKYQENTSREYIISAADHMNSENMENYFWKGQSGIAQFVIENIIKTEDGQMVLCCTDFTRHRFKYIDEKNEIREDIEARTFTQKVAGPTKEVFEKVYNNIQENIEDKIVNKDTEYDSIFLSTKRAMANKTYSEIKDIDNNQRNSEYKKELSALLNV